ncbi:hypothetical protein BpHYR1_023057 [Brachionus plicatilis]|uniref:Uncharacterized protein n=1 Tax=Brachionus plicatilis TaxID=10195 RepID=A0A3M7SLV8_BRAPC|nr:hypothetical protein BpHYR1_023057 [Brachionus plicatilis]
MTIIEIIFQDKDNSKFFEKLSNNYETLHYMFIDSSQNFNFQKSVINSPPILTFSFINRSRKVSILPTMKNLIHTNKNLLSTKFSKKLKLMFPHKIFIQNIVNHYRSRSNKTNSIATNNIEEDKPFFFNFDYDEGGKIRIGNGSENDHLHICKA